jgi:hypothetical protein
MLRRMIMVPLLLALCAGSARAQNRFALEINGGAAFPTEDLGTAALKSGFGLGFTGNVRVMPHVHLYAGWDYHRFMTDELVGSNEFDIDDTGYAFGAKFQHPMAAKMDGWLRVGAMYNHVELEDQNGDIVSDTGHEFGWETGAGISIPLNDRFALMPGMRYRTYGSTLTIGNTDRQIDLSYFTAELRMAFTFGAPPVSASVR